MSPLNRYPITRAAVKLVHAALAEIGFKNRKATDDQHMCMHIRVYGRKTRAPAFFLVFTEDRVEVNTKDAGGAVFQYAEPDFVERLVAYVANLGKT